MVYNAIVFSHLEYCNVVWGNCGISIENRLQIIQNRAARIICVAPWDTSSATVLEQLNWKPLSHRHQYNTSIWIYKMLNNLAPPYLSTGSSFSSNKYNFRQSKNNVFILQLKTDFKKRSLSYRGAILWNSQSWWKGYKFILFIFFQKYAERCFILILFSFVYKSTNLFHLFVFMIIWPFVF